MKYYKKIQLKDGRTCVLRNGTADDAEAVLGCFIRTHTETDNLLSYPDEITFTAEQEAEFLQGHEDSPDAIEIVAVVDGELAGTAGFSPAGRCFKLKHRADMGISVIKKFWGIGIGMALTNACIECAKEAGYIQLELNVLADNYAAIELYKKVGFSEYGRNPKGFHSREGGFREIVYMRLEL